MQQTSLVQASTTPSQDAWPLVEFDRLNFPLVLRGTWVFSQRLNTEKLRETLPALLSLYPHLAGRVEKGLTVRLNNAGVPFSLQENQQLSPTQIQEDHALIDKLVPALPWKRVRKGEIAPLCITVTHLAQGSVLTIHAVHALMDGHSFYHMVRNWSLLSQQQPVPSLTLDQSLHTKAQTIDIKTLNQQALEAGWQKLSLLKLIPQIPYLLFGNKTERAKPIHFSSEALQTLRQAAAKDNPDIRNNDALCAHLAKLGLKLLHPNSTQQLTQAIVLDTRERLAHIPSNFVGNAAFVAPGASFQLHESLADIAARTHDVLKPFLSKPSEKLTQHIQLARDLMAQRSFWVPYDPSSSFGYRPTCAYINSFAKYPIYDIDFGTPQAPCKPQCVIPHNLPDPIVIWPAPPEKGGLEVYFTGPFARAVKRLSSKDPWWDELHTFHKTPSSP